MMNSLNSKPSQTFESFKNQANRRLAMLFIVLIVFEFCLVPLIALAAGKDLNSYGNYLYLYTVTSYAIIALGTIIFQDKGLQVIQDHYSLWTIVVSCFAAAVLAKNYTVYQVILILLGLRLSIHIVISKKSLKMPSLKSVSVGLLWSIGTLIIIALLLAVLNPVQASLPSNLLTYVLSTFLYQIAFVTVIEEACFRGLLFGLLVMIGYQEDRALIIQGILFWAIHYMRITSSPALFFVAIPILAISVSLIAQKYKMLYLSILVHTVINVVGPVLATLL